MANYVDLSKKGAELEKIFSSLINKIPDLCHPAVFRLENENDYFNQTKDLKLEPFRKQEVFERCSTPTLDQHRHEVVSSPTGDYLDISRPSSRHQVDRANFASPSPPPPPPLIKSKSVAFSKSLLSSSRCKNERVRKTTTSDKLNDDSLSAERREALARYERKSALNKRYSKLVLRKRPKSAGSEQTDPNLDRIFEPEVFEQANYPYANPIVECMLASENLDNLRDIIVSSLDIEWRMLTPVRPESEYEENYFDRLIQLHRARYRYQLEQHNCGLPPPPFRHTRHGISSLVSHNNKRHAEQEVQKCLSVGLKLKGRFQSQRRQRVATSAVASLKIPKLTLTSDGADQEEVKTAAQDDNDEQQQQQQKPTGEDGVEFSYGHFSRQNMARVAKANSGELAAAAAAEPKSQQHASPDSTTRNDATIVLDDQIEDIMANLLNARLLNA